MRARASAAETLGPVMVMLAVGSSASSSESASSSAVEAAADSTAGRVSRRGMSILQPVASVIDLRVAPDVSQSRDINNSPLGPMIVPKVEIGTSTCKVTDLLIPL